jgi:hypothetical protein
MSLPNAGRKPAAQRFVCCFPGGHIPARIFTLTCEECGQTYCRRHPCDHVSRFVAEGTAHRADALMAEIDAIGRAA